MARENPFISAVIIFFNEARFLEEAIESVLAQTYDRWELLLVDDGSTDGSREIAQGYVKRYPDSVRYVAHENNANRGMSAARNLGVQAAKGDYIAYLDGDDIWLPHKLEQQVSLLAAWPEAAMVYGPLQTWYSWTGKAEDSDLDGVYGAGKSGQHPYCNQLVPPPDLLSLFLADEAFIPSGGIIRREAIQSAGGYEDFVREGYSDAILFVKLCLRYPVFVAEDSSYKYRQHPDSSTAIALQTGEEFTEERIYLDWVEDYLRAQGVTDAGVWNALNKALWPHRHPVQRRMLAFYRQGIRLAETLVVVGGRRVLPATLRDWLWNKFKDYKQYIYAD